MSENGTSIFRLDARLRNRERNKKKKRSKHYDVGMAIDVRYNAGFYMPDATPATSPQSASYASPATYNVEAFEGSEEDDAAWGTEELGDDDEDRQYVAARSSSFAPAARGFIRSSSTVEDDGTELPVWGTGQLEDESAAPITLSVEQPEADAVWGAGQLEELETPVAASLSDNLEGELPVWGTGELDEAPEPTPTPATNEYASPNAAAMARKLNEEHLLASDDPDTRAFTQDLQSILAGKKEHPSTTKQPPAAEEPEASEDNAAAPSQASSPSASKFSHEIFDRMRPMSAAKTFDLGSYDLSRDFDVFDRHMDSQGVISEAKSHPAQAPRTLASSEGDFAEDLALLAKSPPGWRPRALEAARSFDLRLDVPLIPQQTGYSCWAAGCAMLVAWRDSMSVDPSQIASTTGAWAAYASGLAPQDVSVFPVWGMVAEAAQNYTVEGFCDLLNTFGPLWVASAEPGPHVRVVTGIKSDGTPDGTTLFINDPWEAGMAEFRLPNAGAQYSETYTDFVRKQEALGRRESSIPGAVYVAHLREPRKA